MSERFYAADLDPHASRYRLEGPEARHLVTVLRAKPGDQLELFDGRGRSVHAQICHLERRSVECAVLGPTERLNARSELTIACALPKGERAAWLVEKCTELGVDKLIVLRTERSVRDPSAAMLDRLKRVTIEACKQCGRDRLLDIAPPVDWVDYAPSIDCCRWLLDPSGDEITPGIQHRPLVAAIGPEGGWAESERERARDQGWRIFRLPGHVLRVETAALALAARFGTGPAS